MNRTATPDRMKRDNPSFTFFADDVLAWEPIVWLSDAQLGQAFKLITYACKNGSTLPLDHPILGVLDPQVIEMCTRQIGGRLAVVRPVDLPRLMLDRERYLDAKRKAGSKGGKKSVKARTQKFGDSDPRANS